MFWLVLLQIRERHEPLVLSSAFSQLRIRLVNARREVAGSVDGDVDAFAAIAEEDGSAWDEPHRMISCMRSSMVLTSVGEELPVEGACAIIIGGG